MKTFLLTFVIFFIFALPAFGSPHIATVVHKSGKVLVLKSPKKRSAKRKKEVLYENTFYSYKKVRIGEKVRRGEVLQTGPQAKAKLMFKNGDQIHIGPGTSYRLNKPQKDRSKKKGNSIKLFYGKMRAIISKRGPRRKLRVKTLSAVAGVRGTDFFITENVKTGTQLTVLRGEVDIRKPQQTKSTLIKTGYSAVIKPSLPENLINKNPQRTNHQVKLKDIQIQPSTKQNLISVQSTSTIKGKRNLQALSPRQKEQIQKLEEKAKAVVIEDIKRYQPKAKPNLQLSLEELNTQTVSKVYKKAPSTPDKDKPSEEDLDTIGDDIYKKYFKTKK